MPPLELRDPAEARRFLTQSLCWQRIEPARAENVPAVLDWALAIASEGEPLPPLGFVADVGHMIFPAASGASTERIQPTGWPSPLLRAYEDYVLGKLCADSSFERAGDALRSYRGPDRAKGLAFLLNQLSQRADVAGVLLSPGLLKGLRAIDAAELLREGADSLAQDGAMPLLVTLYERLVAQVRNTSEVLGVEDIFELERRTAVAPFGQRVALRQVLQAGQMFNDLLPRHKPRPLGQRHDVPTRILEEDTYPVGGFASIATRGSIESLLHSQLAFMEEDDRPDLFDIKFVRDELLYYSRDENSFLRRRRSYLFALYPDLVQTRFKDAELPFQRAILLLALLRTAVSSLTDWLHTDSLVFEFILIDAKGGSALAPEEELLRVLFAEQIANGLATIETLTLDQLVERCASRGKRSLCHCMLTSVREQSLEAADAIVSRLVLDAPIPAFGIARDPLSRPEADTPLLGWTSVLEQLLASWI